MYNMYPYMYRNFRTSARSEHGTIGQQVPFKRGDLEGYTAAKDFASRPYSECMRSNAMAKIHVGNVLRADMTPKEYINLLIRQGQVPDKHFKYRPTENGYEISEINSYHEVTKRVIFNKPEFDKEMPVICQYFTPDTGRKFKEVRYLRNGETETHIDYEDLFDETEAIEQLEKLEELKKAGPKILEGNGNPFMQEPPNLPGVDTVKSSSPLHRLAEPQAVAATLSNTPLKSFAHVPYCETFSDRQKLTAGAA